MKWISTSQPTYKVTIGYPHKVMIKKNFLINTHRK